MVALRRATAVKEARRQFLRDVKASRQSVVEALCGEIPDYLTTCSMHKLITAYRNFPERRFRRIMDAADAGLARLVGEMTDRQLAIVCEHLEEWEKAHPVEVAAR